MSPRASKSPGRHNEFKQKPNLLQSGLRMLIPPGVFIGIQDFSHLPSQVTKLKVGISTAAAINKQRKKKKYKGIPAPYIKLPGAGGMFTVK